MKKNEEKILIKKLKLAMLESGLNQTQLAKKLGISHASVSAWLHNKANPGLDLLEKIAQVTGKPVNYFFDNSTHLEHGSCVVGNNNQVNAEDKNTKELEHLKTILQLHQVTLENIKLRLEKLEGKK